MKTLLSTTVLGLLLGSLVAADPPSPPPSVAAGDASGNAALWYWRAFVYMRQSPGWLNNPEKHGPSLTAPMPDGAAQEQDVALSLLRQGAELPSGDFGYRIYVRENGPLALLPEFTEMKTLALRCRYRATWRFEHGRDREAVEDCLAVMAMGADLARDGVLINRLVAVSIQGVAMAPLKRFLPVCSPAACRTIATSLTDPRHRLPPFTETIASERVVVEWSLAHPDDPRIEASLKENAVTPDVLRAALQENDRLRAAFADLEHVPAAEYRARLAAETEFEKGRSDPAIIKEMEASFEACLDTERRQATAAQVIVAAAGSIHSDKGLAGLEGATVLDGTLTVTPVGASTVLAWHEDAAHKNRVVIGEPLPKPPAEVPTGNDH